MPRGRPWHVLAAILLVYIMIIVLPSTLVDAVNVAILGGMLVLIARGQPGATRWIRVIGAAAVALVVATVVATTTGDRDLRGLVAQLSAVVLVVTAVALLTAELIRAPRADGAAVVTALCVYLLLALLFAAVHSVAAIFHPDYLRGAGEPPSEGDTLYFSIITLTTVGFGDLSPATRVARAVAGIEALVGQLFLVSVVAATVARYERPRPGP